jgi:actin-like ATPase involved in cell morphogenesis
LDCRVTDHSISFNEVHAGLPEGHALLNSEVEKCITETLKGISERYEIVIDEVGFDQNHIHIF